MYFGIYRHVTIQSPKSVGGQPTWEKKISVPLRHNLLSKTFTACIPRLSYKTRYGLYFEIWLACYLRCASYNNGLCYIYACHFSEIRLVLRLVDEMTHSRSMNDLERQFYGYNLGTEKSIEIVKFSNVYLWNVELISKVWSSNKCYELSLCAFLPKCHRTR